MSKRIISVEDITIPEALKLLEDMLSRYGISEVEVSEVLTYLRRFSKTDAESAKKIVEELVSKFGIARMTAIQIVNIMPKYVEELRTILGLEKREFTDEELQEMLNIIDRYRKKK
ncbi:MAG: RNA polymerase Rpb4 [Crenarchaeota archaeon]|nr:RNA polymerase Rpb4 [Thermoproteota archaeon]